MTYPLDGFDVIHASPPCQAYSVATLNMGAARDEFPDLVDPIRRRLAGQTAPWIIENVPGAPVRPDFRLCGCQFGLPLLKRERWFETSWHAFTMSHPCHHPYPSLSVTGHGVGGGNGQRRRLAEHLGYLPVTRNAREAMGIDWMTRDELSQAIPPAYTQLIGEQALLSVTSCGPLSAKP
jgi:DNA (cytosine-5)-methyltransferase 1